ncbi:TPA: hypothetical protein N0F65_005528 [Lagenidium giganteum]|uniref:Uncharacterized protein n=1 Tax=Lagenidium giganteum TaxID=4803 RepID=A0AAV2YV31_9STRA|nr:TPA: hypothetical protein N0F65_005528 [Lagenidium giganteum]
MIVKDSLDFCSMVDYVAVVDANDEKGEEFDKRARFYYDNVNVVLLRFGCHAKYSLYTCDDFREAYKYWICSIKFQRCGRQVTSTGLSNGGTLINGARYFHDVCTAPFPTLPSMEIKTDGGAVTTTTECREAVSGRHRTCLSLCEDVVRKCPYVLNFQCPSTETRFFSTDIAVCNKLNRTKNPDRPDKPWPGTFAST